LHVRPASPSEVDVALELLDEAAEWMAAIGQPNWPTPFPRRRVTADATAGELHLASLDGVVVGTITLQWEDPRFWGDTGTDGRAGYVHRLAVRRAQAGSGLGARLLVWADERVRDAGRDRLRLDVVSDNPTLRRYYEHNGFGHVRDASGDYELPDGTLATWRTSLYERAVGESRGDAIS
jgi:GNAT superfamily N-acetyltransferase